MLEPNAAEGETVTDILVIDDDDDLRDTLRAILGLQPQTPVNLR